MANDKWKSVNWGQYHTLNVGRIGVLRIEGYVGENWDSDWYDVTWTEPNGSPILIIDEKIPATPKGLEVAKKRAIEWAKELLQEAMDSLEGGDDVNE